MQVQWFPGHMAKTLRQLKDWLKLVEGLVELRDARAPLSTANPEVRKVGSGKKRFVVFTKADLADPDGTRAWEEYFLNQDIPFFSVDPRDQSSVKGLATFLSQGKDRAIKRYMIVGVPNVGKSTLINAIGRRASAKTGNRPGVTRGLQWITVNSQLELLDTPGLLWPKFANELTGLHLALIGSISDQRFDMEEAALHLLKILEEQSPGALADRYGLAFPEDTSLAALYDYLIAIAAKRGHLRPGGIGDPNQMAITLIKEFRAGQLGRITLELPNDLQSFEREN